ncbi:MAG: glycosyltransferase [Chloroflexota bacterium]|nr:glycosyltransferase [Chloroflexota bacterium]
MSNDFRKRILVLSAESGLGHKSAAEALQSAFQIKFGDGVTVEIINPLDHPETPKFLRDSQSNYDEIVKKLPEIYKFGYEISDWELPVSLLEGGLIVAMYEAFREIVLEYTPDLVVSAYPLYAAPLSTVLELNDLPKIPIVTSITDLVSVHQVWFNTNVTLLTVPTEDVFEDARQAGFSEDQLLLTGIPVKPEIGKLQETDKATIRKELGWEINKPTALAVASPRVTNLKTYLKDLDNLGIDFQWAIVAGGNDPLYEALNRIKWQHAAKVYNFVEEMPKFLRASDLIICKAGGLITTESLAAGLPILFIQALPGQETGNVEYVIGHQAGAFCENSAEICEKFSDWFVNDGEILKTMAHNAKVLGKPNAALEIATASWELIDESPSTSITIEDTHRLHGLNALLEVFDIKPQL